MRVSKEYSTLYGILNLLDFKSIPSVATEKPWPSPRQARYLSKRSSNLTGLAITKTGTQKGDFSVSALGKTSLISGAITTFKVTFKPSAAGTRNAVIHISSNDANENPFDITLSGMGLAP